MTTPVVTELPRKLEPTTPDPFADDGPPDDPARPRLTSQRKGTSMSTPCLESQARALPRFGGGFAADSNAELAKLVRAAAAGDNAAWSRLVERFDPWLRNVARAYRLRPVDVDDVVQETWLRLFKHIARVREPAALASWLATTVRRESLRVLQAPVREELSDDRALGECPDTRTPETELLAAERSEVLRRALATFPERHRQLMTLLMCDEGCEYTRISGTLGVPRGSIGPIRARCIARLARDPELRELLAVTG